MINSAAATVAGTAAASTTTTILAIALTRAKVELSRELWPPSPAELVKQAQHGSC